MAAWPKSDSLNILSSMGSTGTRLSSRLTFFYKFVLSGVTVLSVGLWILSFFAEPIDMGSVWLYIILAWLVPLKTVCADPDGVRVGNFREEVTIPYAEIESIQEHYLVNPHLISIYFKRSTQFGKRILFMPYVRMSLAFWKEHPAATLLRERTRAVR